MALNFPNRSRSYDPVSKRVRFTGYDGLFQVPFLVEIDALSEATATPDSVENAYLAAFDAARTSIQAAAMKAYAHGRKAIYVLTAADIR
ncbi:DUF1488 domain-containing protein [Phyllobacterium zundukense]|uniref:DUF1488 domain-containing protein n=1 Tax=Phyllobacterium zundukense TaxID=1867719 RepID=A0A2N9VU96_9HYPH|nr:DUF1488 domain-containing protein [Phyllobacterium zundukense]ATU92991.1 hypothetical protein BLM14_16265 [Phyllobacterium zundukense]PIO43064.1 hypothetical protein B5P45_21830 [Phyllobacterium zundukense]